MKEASEIVVVKIFRFENIMQEDSPKRHNMQVFLDHLAKRPSPYLKVISKKKIDVLSVLIDPATKKGAYSVYFGDRSCKKGSLLGVFQGNEQSLLTYSLSSSALVCLICSLCCFLQESKITLIRRNSTNNLTNHWHGNEPDIQSKPFLV